MPDYNDDKPIHITPAVIAAMARGDFTNAVIAATPGGIEAQEAAGMTWLLTAGVLPKSTEYNWYDEAGLKRIGFTFGNPHDDIFVKATLPNGWAAVLSEDSRQAELVDAHSCCRAVIFYKAAFYDRHANMRLIRRFEAHFSRTESGGIGYRYVVMDNQNQEVVFEGGPFLADPWNEDSDARSEQLTRCEDWLNANRPSFRDALAYWGEL